MPMTFIYEGALIFSNISYCPLVEKNKKEGFVQLIRNTTIHFLPIFSPIHTVLFAGTVQTYC